MKDSDRKTLALRILISVLGNTVIGFGVAIAKIADLGIDPFNGMTMGVSGALGVPYPVFTWGFNLLCFTAELIWGRKYINVGTFINWFLVSFAVSGFLSLFGFAGLTTPEGLPPKLAMLLLALLLMSLGLAIYQSVDFGIAPFDAIPIMFCERHPRFPYFWARILLDSTAVLGILLTDRSLCGIGTLATALGLGPIVHFFMNRLQKRFPSLMRSASSGDSAD